MHDNVSHTTFIFMKIDSKYRLREIAGETIIVQQGKTGADLTKIISLNASACELFKQLSGKDFTIEEAATVLVDTYHIDRERALTDATSWADALKNCHVILD